MLKNNSKNDSQKHDSHKNVDSEKYAFIYLLHLLSNSTITLYLVIVEMGWDLFSVVLRLHEVSSMRICIILWVQLIARQISFTEYQK